MVWKINRSLAPLVACLLLGLVGCAGQRAFRSGEELAREGKYDEAVRNYATAVQKAPESHEYRLRLMDTRSKAAQAHLQQARQLFAAGERLAAIEEFRLAEGFDPTLETAATERRQAENLLRAGELVGEAEELYRSRRFQQARSALDTALDLDPGNAAATALLEKIRSGRRTVVDGQELDVTSDKPINLKFKETDIKDVFNILSKLSGINFILDEEIKAKTFSLLLEDASFPQALEVVLQLNKLGKKVLNPRTIIVYPRTKEKDKQFDDQLIQTFYLSNIDAKKAVNLLRTMLSLRKVYVHEELNALVIRDTPDVIKLAGQILESADRADSEVVFDLELIEVSHGDDLLWGPSLSANKVNVGLGYFSKTGNKIENTIVGDTLVGGITKLTGLDTIYTIPTATFDFAKTLTDSETLANPKIRVKNKEKAKVHVGLRQPIITVTQTGGTTGTITENVQYVDVGVKLDIEPVVQLDNSVFTKMSLEVSSLGARLTGTQSTVFPITTTNAQTNLTLKDGEQTVIGGLMRNENTTTKKKIPIIGDFPLIGDLLSGFSKNKGKREILLSITPHIVKNVTMPLPSEAAIWSGGEEDLKAGPAFGTFSGSFDPQTDRRPQALVPGLERPAASAQPAEQVPAAGEVPEPAAIPAEPLPLSLDAAAPAAAVPAAEAAPPATGESAAAPFPATPVVPATPTTPVVPSTEGTLPVPDGAATVAGLPAPPPPAETAEALVQLPAFEVPPVADGALSFAGSAVAGVGQELALTVVIKGGTTIFSAPLFVSYDAERLEFVRAEEGDFLKQGGGSTIFVVSPVPGQGQLIVGYKQGVGGSGASGDGTLFRLFFRPRLAGTAPLALDRLNFRDASGRKLNVVAQPFQLEIR